MEPSDIILIIVLHSLALGIAGYFVGSKREIGPIAGGFLGLLGIIGLIIVLVSPRKESIPFSVQVQRYKELLDSGTITEAEYNHLKGRLIEAQ